MKVFITVCRETTYEVEMDITKKEMEAIKKEAILPFDVNDMLMEVDEYGDSFYTLKIENSKHEEIYEYVD